MIAILGNNLHRLMILLFLGSALTGCALFDLVPAKGWPPATTETAETPELLPSSDYDFHNNPRL